MRPGTDRCLKSFQHSAFQQRPCTIIDPPKCSDIASMNLCSAHFISGLQHVSISMMAFHDASAWLDRFVDQSQRYSAIAVKLWTQAA